MKVETNHFYDFGPFRIDIAERVLLQDGRPVHLTNKSFDVLVALIERSGHVVGKDELIEKVWPDCFVEEGNLAVTVSMLGNCSKQVEKEILHRDGSQAGIPLHCGSKRDFKRRE